MPLLAGGKLGRGCVPLLGYRELGDEADDVMDASPGKGGWRPEGVRPGLCHLFSLHPAPPGPHALVGTEEDLGGISATAETSVTPLQRICGWGLCDSEYRPFPPPPALHTYMHSRGRLLCERVGGGVLSVPSALKHGLHHNPDPGDGLPCRCPCFQGKMNLLSYIPAKKFCSLNLFP